MCLDIIWLSVEARSGRDLHCINLNFTSFFQVVVSMRSRERLVNPPQKTVMKMDVQHTAGGTRRNVIKAIHQMEHLAVEDQGEVKV